VLLPPAWLILVLVLALSFPLELRHLGHTALTHWDEVFHAVVAQNVLKHPLKPTLVEVPYLSYSREYWPENHVWQHKPILPFWQVALSFALLGVNAFALRLPSAILSTGAAWLTYLIGKELFDRRTALIAAILQATNPFIIRLVQGYEFADLVDVALLFWVEIGVYFVARAVRTGSWRDVLLAGLAQGLAFLSKSYLAGIILGIALAVWLLPMFRLASRENCRLDALRLAGLLGIMLVTILPWQFYCMTRYPEEFWHEHAQIWKHLTGNVENWAAPWDRLVFDYLIWIYGVFYTPVLVAGIVLLGKAVIQRHVGLWLVHAWGLGVLLPHLFATTKTPSATLIAMPALFLLLAHLCSQACRGELWSLAALAGVALVSVLSPAVVKSPGFGFPDTYRFGGVMRQAFWVVEHVAGALGFLSLAVSAWLLAREFLPPGWAIVRRASRVVTVAFCVCVLSWLEFETVRAAWAVTSRNVNDPSSAEAGQFIRKNLPDNAVLLCEETKPGEHVAMMFYADRTCYALGRANADEMAALITRAGGIPYLVSYRRLPFTVVYSNGDEGPTVYFWPSDKGRRTAPPGS
jgi:4-amino-4-deoxy-L-arabinose transferase